MPRIIIRAGMSPFDTFNAPRVITTSAIASNVGNLLYQFSLFRTLMTPGTTITPDYGQVDVSRADEINANFDLYVIAMADAFRPDFEQTLVAYTDLIERLRIPVVLIGVGLRAPFEPDLEQGFPFDETVARFIRAVLARSATIGVRGQITADYLSGLGFTEGADHQVIGCPSMYTFGRELAVREPQLDHSSRLGINSSALTPVEVREFLTRTAQEYRDYTFVPQQTSELKLTLTGTHPLPLVEGGHYPTKASEAPYRDDRVRFFLNAPTWFDFMRDLDLAVGSRLHGNIAATLVGTPSIMITKDARMRELAELHQLTHVPADQITARTRLAELVEQADFHSPESVQAANFDRFTAFLDHNELAHIYQSASGGGVPFDEALASIKLQPPVRGIASLDHDQLVARFEEFFPLEAARRQAERDAARQRTKLRADQASQNAEMVRVKAAATGTALRRTRRRLASSREEVAELRASLDRPLVRWALRLSTKLSRR